MFAFIVVIHVLVSVLLVLVVLLQSGRGAELGAAFGSVGQATFGRGRPTFLSRFTTVLAVIFMTTSLVLAFMSNEAPSQSVISPTTSESATPPAAQPGEETRPPENLPTAEQTLPQQPAEATQPEAAPQPVPLQPTDAPPQPKQ